MKTRRVLELLERHYGVLQQRRRQSPLDVLIQTILSQNTSDVNSGRAFSSLVQGFGSWDQVASAPVDEIAAAIRSGGLYRVKAARIKHILTAIREQTGVTDLEFLGALSLAEATQYLLGLPGVGRKTASCVLLFALGKPSLPVDTHVHRVASRLRLIGGRVSVEKAHSMLGGMLPADKVYEFHLHMIEHGRRVCHARQPRCAACIFGPECPSFLVAGRTMAV